VEENKSSVWFAVITTTRRVKLLFDREIPSDEAVRAVVDKTAPYKTENLEVHVTLYTDE
jgi:hypothetical protein